VFDISSHPASAVLVETSAKSGAFELKQALASVELASAAATVAKGSDFNASPASIVSVQAASSEITGNIETVYSKPVAVTAYSQPMATDQTGVTAAMEGQLKQSSGAKFLGDSISQLSSLIRAESSQFSQTISTGVASINGVTAVPSLPTAGVATQFSMQLTTKDGDSIDFKVAFGANGLSPTLTMEYSLDGDLSDEELADIDKLMSMLSRETDGFINSGNIDLSTLKLSELGSISGLEIDIKDKTNKARDGLLNGNYIKLSYSTDGTDTDLSINLNGDKLDLSGVALHFSAMVGEAKVEQSQQHYLQLIKDNVGQALGSPEQSKFIADAFMLVQGLSSSTAANPEKIGTEQETVLVSPLAAGPKLANSRDQSLLTGLDDFKLSFVSHKEQPNAADKPLQYQGYNLDLSQQTSVSGKLGYESISQRQGLELSAHYYEPVSYLENPDFDTQTYRYSVLEKSASTTSVQSYDNFELQSAVVYRSAQQDLNTVEFQLGKMVSNVSTPQQSSSVEDFTQTLAAQEGEQQLDLLDSVLLKDLS